MSRARSKKSLAIVVPSQREWHIDKLVPGGAGFLRLSNGQGAFATGALPGERISVSQAEDHRAYLQATRWTLLEASADRIEPICPVQSRCGGCDLMTLRYPAQLRAKAEILLDALTRVGRFESLPALPFVAADQALAYRSRIRLHVGADGQLGFFAAGSRELVEIPGCLVAQPELDAALLQLRAIVGAHRAALARLSELELRVAPSDPRLSVRLISKTHPLEVAALIAALSESFSVSVAERSSEPGPDQRFPLPAGVALRAPAAAFTQVNWAMNQRLVQALLDGAEKRAARSFCDLYCGAGISACPSLLAG